MLIKKTRSSRVEASAAANRDSRSCRNANRQASALVRIDGDSPRALIRGKVPIVPDLKRVFLDYDLNLLHVIADLWGVELSASNQHEAAEASTLLERVLLISIAKPSVLYSR